MFSVAVEIQIKIYTYLVIGSAQNLYISIGIYNICVVNTVVTFASDSFYQQKSNNIIITERFLFSTSCCFPF